MKIHRDERNFFLVAIAFVCWIYVWRVGGLIKHYKELKKEVAAVSTTSA
jgi:hypothetical protein